jgi:hypothetical protein
LRPRVGRRLNLTSAAPHKKREGARDAKGPERTQVYAGRRKQGARTHGPRRLAASRHAEGPNPSSRLTALRRATASPPNPRRPARGVCRFAPCRPRWTHPFQATLLSLRIVRPPLHRNRAQMAPGISDHAGAPPSVGPRRRAVRHAGTRAAWTAGRENRAASPTPPARPPLPAPRPETLIRHPSRLGRDLRTIILFSDRAIVLHKKEFIPGLEPGRILAGFAAVAGERRRDPGPWPCPLDSRRRTGHPLARARAESEIRA